LHASHATIFAVVDLADVADRAAAIVSEKAVRGDVRAAFLLCGTVAARRLGLEGVAMTGQAKVWLGKARLLSHSHLATQAAVLLPVIAVAGLTAWTMSAPTRAMGQSTSQTAGPSAGQGALAPGPAEAGKPAAARLAAVEPTVTSEPPAVNGLKISSQSWRRGGLGSNALVTLTLRNANGYAVKDIEIACSFSRQDGSHLTDRRRIIPDAVVDMKSRKTFARVHIGFVNVYANKAKCEPVAANRV
jgi:hypothetical protein